MSLGVLNNLSAMYAANNLSNTQSSLSKTLQQLSSGSKINSGADDAAGLSLVNGLQANSQALTQSQTNAQEGVGLLRETGRPLSAEEQGFHSTCFPCLNHSSLLSLIDSAKRSISCRISAAGKCTRWPWPGKTHSK